MPPGVAVWGDDICRPGVLVVQGTGIFISVLTVLEVAPGWPVADALTEVVFEPLVIPDFAFTVRVTFVFAPGASVTVAGLTADGVVKLPALESVAARVNVVLPVQAIVSLF